ncbi:hypothetical protein DES52_11826 [Deinococcus yavapaiensis KR-236]|uniref:Uncharacterized protein n=1 Tax=Deinococcus yavapaiensis KR-236 TaxID=694435 RepID=A0A318S326_9DEIO|nr:hypothetical protein DES52_11826 [Deinococcus yavapaiensis KR-236]
MTAGYETRTIGVRDRGLVSYPWSSKGRMPTDEGV